MVFTVLNSELLYQHSQGKILKQHRAELAHSNYQKKQTQKHKTK